jgi:hypothetical protein
MDEGLFDAAIRTFADPNRRTLLGAIIASGMAAFSSLPFLEAEAKKKGKGKKKKKKCKPACNACEKCVNRTCLARPDGTNCPGGECLNGACCESPKEPCGDTCCANLCCLGTCCAQGLNCDPFAGECVEGCITGQQTCDDLPGNPECCPTIETCCQNGECCASNAECCHEAGTENYYCSSFGCVL